MQKKNFKPKKDKAKYGLMIRAKISHFLLWSGWAFRWGEGEREKRRIRKKKRKRNPGLEVWNS